jgi:hypothetical protein
MMLPEKTLWHTDEDPEGNLLRTQAVALPCRSCKHVLLLTRDDSRVSGHGRPELHPPETVYLEYILGCEGSGCKFRAPLYVQWSADTTVEERQAYIESWKWDDLRCPQGHVVLNPGYEWKD